MGHAAKRASKDVPDVPSGEACAFAGLREARRHLQPVVISKSAIGARRSQQRSWRHGRVRRLLMMAAGMAACHTRTVTWRPMAGGCTRPIRPGKLSDQRRTEFVSRTEFRLFRQGYLRILQKILAELGMRYEYHSKRLYLTTVRKEKKKMADPRPLGRSETPNFSSSVNCSRCEERAVSMEAVTAP